jgi:hypothetical protein
VYFSIELFRPLIAAMMIFGSRGELVSSIALRR